MSKGNIARIWFKGFCPVKSRIKYAYYKISSILLGKASLDYARQGCGHWLARLLPGRSSAVLLTIKGKLSGVGYNRWLRSNARAHKVSCWIRRRDKNTVEALFVGRLKRVYTLADLVKSLRFTRIDEINERWLVKEKAKELAALMGSLGGEEDGGRKFTITFAGDTSLGDYYLRKPGLEKEYKRLQKNPMSFFKKVAPLVKGSSILILNLETVLAENPVSPLKGIKKWMGWDNPKRTLGVLKELGVNAVSLANNHTMDFGPEILKQTQRLLNKAGILTFGAGSSLREAAKPIKIQFKVKNSNKNIYVFGAMHVKWARRFQEDYNYYATKNSPGVNILGIKRICSNISRIRKKDPDAIIIVFAHWQGCDYEWAPEKVKLLSKKLLSHGSDYVFGHGSHTMQELEVCDSGLISYSIGNFVFNSKGRYKIKKAPPFSFIVRLELHNKDSHWGIKIKLYPIISDNLLQGFQPRPVNEHEFYKLVKLLKDRAAHPKKFLKHFKLSKDGYGWHILYGDIKDEETVTFELPYDKEIFKQLILGENRYLSCINFDDADVVSEHIKHLEWLHDELDSRFTSYYRTLFRSKLFRHNNKDGEQFYEKLSKILKSEYVTHNFLRKLERRKLKVEKAISFRNIMIENSAIRRLGCPEYAWLLDRKINAYKFADRIGLRRPKNNLKIYKLSEIEEKNEPVVIKPVHSTGSMGVYLVFNKNTILSAKEGIYLNSWSELMEDASRKLAAGKAGKSPLLKSLSRDKWMVEELIVGEDGDNTPASDLKFYCFYGEVIIVSESNPAFHKKFCYWDVDMNLVETGRYQKKFYAHGKGFTKEDLEIAIKTSLEIPAPFIRLDMLKGQQGLVFCEATPRPGNFHLFNKEYDRKFGEAYRRAERRILKDLLNGKKFEAFTSVFQV